jgi:voltage-gated potassium channel
MKPAFLSRFSQSGLILLILTVFVLFLLPILPDPWLPTLYPVCFTGIFLSAAFSLRRSKRFHFTVAIALSIIQFVATLANLEWVLIILRSLQIVYFMVIVIALVHEITTSKEVDAHVIMNAITAYLLLGIALALVVTILGGLVPGSYNIEVTPIDHNSRYITVRELTYYTFITYTTTGYGDILPMLPASRTLAILISTCGQLYIAIILAMLVGKFSSSSK